jgi:hypothetical protein
VIFKVKGEPALRTNESLRGSSAFRMHACSDEEGDYSPLLQRSMYHPQIYIRSSYKIRRKDRRGPPSPHSRFIWPNPQQHARLRRRPSTTEGEFGRSQDHSLFVLLWPPPSPLQVRMLSAALLAASTLVATLAVADTVYVQSDEFVRFSLLVFCGFCPFAACLLIFRSGVYDRYHAGAFGPGPTQSFYSSPLTP